MPERVVNTASLLPLTDTVAVFKGAAFPLLLEEAGGPLAGREPQPVSTVISTAQQAIIVT